MVSFTIGTLMAKRFRGEKDFVGLSCIGEGGMQTGSFHEGMNIAAVEQVPLVVVATNNHYAYSTSTTANSPVMIWLIGRSVTDLRATALTEPISARAWT